MRAFLSTLFIIAFMGEVFSQDLDSLAERSMYRRAWDAAISDGKISDEERVLMNLLVESLVISADSSRAWETHWAFNTPNQLDQSGRWPLVLQNIVIGAGLYGWGIPYVLQAEDARWMIGGEMISMGGAFYLTYQYTKNMEVTHARTQMMRFGSLLGLRYGIGVNEIFDWDDREEDEERQTLWAWVLMASVPAGHYGGESLFEKYNPSNGQAWAWTLWTGISGVTARSIHSAVDPAPEYPQDECLEGDACWDHYDEELDEWRKRGTVVELLAYPLGLYGGYRLTRDKQYSFGDALMLLQGWGFGFYNTMMVQSILMDEFNEDTFMMIASLGAIGSTFAYDYWIQNEDFSFGQSTLMFLGSASGTAFGFGTAILLDMTENKEGFLSLALLGYGAGTYLTRQILDVKGDGLLSQTTSNHISINPTMLPVSYHDQKVRWIPAIDLSVSFR